MGLPAIPAAKLPQFALPAIRIPVHIPHVGCPGSDGRSYIGEQFGSLPDLYDALHTKHLRKVINDQIYALLKGQLPTIFRKVLYLQKAQTAVQKLAKERYQTYLGELDQQIGKLGTSISCIAG
jgi:hypothetical protein